MKLKILAFAAALATPVPAFATGTPSICSEFGSLYAYQTVHNHAYQLGSAATNYGKTEICTAIVGAYFNGCAVQTLTASIYPNVVWLTDTEGNHYVWNGTTCKLNP